MLVLLNLHTFEVTKQGSSYVMYYNQQQIEGKKATDTSHYTAFFQISKYFFVFIKIFNMKVGKTLIV
jgi:hypothetical protein